ncbi:MAG: type II secretion system protein J [Gammaproteobacteria bacterium]|nr:MAG: type II secretion system protein J [Gammaproteobacteria bacterium]
MARKSERPHGFTLIELLVALAVFAALSVMAYGGLNSVLRAREHTAAAAERLHRLALATTRIERDLLQWVSQAGRDEFGDPRPAFGSGDDRRGRDAGWLLEFTRGGWANPAAAPRSTLQRVAYQFEEGTLYRLHWPRLYAGPEDRPHRAALLRGLERVELAFLDRFGQWHERWPPLNAPPDIGLPRALRLTLYFEDESEVERLFAMQP